MATIDTAQLALKMLGPRMESDSRRSARSVRILNDTVVNQIAAGEVVERPYSVVKELVENAIDAGAGNIVVVIDHGGQSNIEVIDNGCGMSKDDALLAIERYGTSKLEVAEDLFSIGTLGFRGEALSSISAVSKFSLSTSRHEPEGIAGVEVRVEGGRVRDVVSRQLPGGTRVCVRQLFFNTPARKKFLRSERSEAAAIKALVCDFAAAYPKIRFRLVADGQEQLNLPACPNFFDRVTFLRLAGSDSLEVEEHWSVESGEYYLAGVLSKPRDTAVGASRLRLIVNGRSVRDRILLKAVRDAYGNFLKGDRYPFGVLSLDLPPTDLDVNVHPQKAEIRFRHPDRIFKIVRAGIANAFRRAQIASAPESNGPERSFVGEVVKFASTTPSPAGSQQPITFYRTYTNPFPIKSSTDVVGVTPSVQSESATVSAGASPIELDLAIENRDLPAGYAPKAECISSMRYLGQIFECYLLLEGGGKFVVVDMHAAHERVTYAKIKAQVSAGQVQAQLLITPEVVELSPEQIERFERLQNSLSKLGFECELFSSTSAIVRSVPAMLSQVSPGSMFSELVSMEEGASTESRVEDWMGQAVARLACHGSIRSGRKLEREEVYALLEAMESTEVAAFCPHGRPVMVSLTERQLEGMFGRI